MKCIQCDTDNNWRDRRENEGRCKNCGHTFVFDLQKGSQFTDLFFKNALNAISAENTLYFTPQQLDYLIKRRSKSISLLGLLGDYIKYLCTTIFILFLTAGYFIKNLNYSEVETIVMLVAMLYNICFIVFCWLRSDYSKINYKSRQANAKMLQVLGAIVIIITAIGRNGVPVILLPVSAFLGMLSIYLGYRDLNRQAEIGQDLDITKNQIEDWLQRWQQVNINPIKILPKPSQDISATVNDDIIAYSLDRVMVCDNDAIAQMLIANNFHFENNCAVLSITGYPQSIFDTVMQMLRRNQNLTVYALHDASPQGVSIGHKLRADRNWFPDNTVSIIDIGLLPRQVLASRNMFVLKSSLSASEAKQLPADICQSLSAKELRWLELGNFVELESFTPRRLLQVLTQGIARSLDIGSDDTLIYIYGDGDDEDTTMIFASESFG